MTVTSQSPGHYSVTVNAAQVQQQNAQQDRGQPAGSSFKATSASVGDASRTVIGATGNDLTTRATEFARYTANSEAPGSAKDVNATFRTTAGSRVSPADVKPETLVEIGGMRTTVRSAMASGLLIKDGDGSYRVRGEAPAAKAQRQSTQQDQPETQQHDQQSNQEQPTERVADLAPEAHDYVQGFASKVDNVTATSVMEGIMREGTVSDHDVAQVASLMGIEASEAQQRISTVRTAFENQAREMVGQNADDIFKWAYANEPAMMREAIKSHVEQEDPRAYDAVRFAYWANLDRTTPEALLSASNARDLDIRKEGNAIMVSIPGYPRMSFAAAVRAGLIVARPSNRRR